MNIKTWNIRVTISLHSSVIESSLGKHNANYYCDMIRANYHQQENQSLEIVLTGRSNERFSDLDQFRIFLEDQDLIQSNSLSCCSMQ